MFQLFFVGFVVLGVIRGVELARLDGVMCGMMAVTGGGIGEAGGGVDVSGLMVGHRFTVVVGGQFVVIGGAGMMFGGSRMGGHGGVSNLG